MANHCYNSLKVWGDEKQLKSFVKKGKAKIEGKKVELSFEKFYPTPKELLETQSPNSDEKLVKKFQKKYGARDWYQWRVKFWGTKWDCFECVVDDEDDDYIVYQFDTAWSPPLALLETISKDYPELRFKIHYEEGGAGFEGIAIIDNGVMDDKCIEI